MKALLVPAGSCSVLDWVGLVGGYRCASPVILARLEHVALIAGAIAGSVIRDELPIAPMPAGVALIVASGLQVVHREVE